MNTIYRYSTDAWWFIVIWFCVWETLGVLYAARHKGDDKYTFTHFLAVHIPIPLRVALLAWLVYHFLWQHPKG